MQINANGLHILKQALFNCFLSGAHFFLAVKTIRFFRPCLSGFFFLLSTFYLKHNQAIWMDSWANSQLFMLFEFVAQHF